MKVCILLLSALVLIAIPASPQVTSRGVELTADHANAYTWRARVTTRRAVRRTYRRNYYYYH